MLRSSVEYAVPVQVAFEYLADPRNRPEWQGSLRSVELIDEGPPRVGQRWLDRTRPGLVPTMEITELVPDRAWSETGRWRGLVLADLTLQFSPRVPEGCRVDVAFGVRGRGPLRPLGWLASGAGLLAVRSDLARAGRILAERQDRLQEDQS
jgi:uncharacterized protein YndB with AHSA1/START domain